MSLTKVPGYIKIPYLVIVVGLILCGVLTLALQNCRTPSWINSKAKLSLGLSAVAALLFMISQQPYAAMFAFLFLVIKALMLIKWT
ncbi:MAG: hypothetical protein PHG07_10825 [Lachnospiraceae bacterium]|nr:hypothetical protein [Lachnospiraceae bacterium]